MCKLKVGSLFCGAGGLDLGLTHAGHRIIWAYDNDQDSVDTYRTNIGSHAFCEDVSNVDFSQQELPDVIVGGFPCQGFSVANKFRGGSDDRNLLYKQFVRALRELRPKYFLAENVKGILSLDKGQAIRIIIEEFNSVGYRTDLRLLNASNFGVPQNRERVFIVGIKNDSEAIHIWPDPGLNPKILSVGEALSGVPEPDTSHSLLNHIGSKYKVTNRNFTGCRPTDPSKPSPTIIARGNGGGGVNALQHPKNHRRMTVREQALIQTFPIDFEFYGSMSSCYRQIGNAVPVRLAEHFGKCLSMMDT